MRNFVDVKEDLLPMEDVQEGVNVVAVVAVVE